MTRRLRQRAAVFFVGLAGWLGMAITLAIIGCIAAGIWDQTP